MRNLIMDFLKRCKLGIIPGFLSLMTALLGGCATESTDRQAPATRSQIANPSAVPEPFDTSPILATQALVLATGDLQIAYLDSDREITVRGSLATAEERGGPGRNDLSAGVSPPIVPFAVRPPELPGSEAAGEPVVIRAAEDWQRLVLRLQEEIVGLVPDQGVVLDVLRQEDIFLYVDKQRQLQAVAIEDKPLDIQPAKVITLTDLLQDAADRVRQSLQQESGDTRYLLYNTGDLPNTGFPFVFMDLEKRRVFFIQKTPGDGRVLVHGPASAVNATYHVVASQAMSLTSRPVSSFARLVSSLGATTIDTAHLMPTWKQSEVRIPPLTDAANMDTEAWEHELDAMTGSSATRGKIRYLVDGEEFFPALIHAITGAQRSIRMRLYIFDNDDYAMKIAALLKRRSKDVTVEILLDGLGTIAGGMAQPGYTPGHLPPAPRSIARHLRQDSDVHLRMLSNPLLQGDHSKVIILDDELAFLGGMNIGREYRYEWHDLMVEVSGPVVDTLIRDFEKTWAHAGVLGDLQAAIHRTRHPVRQADDGDYPVRVLYTKPGNSQILRTQLSAMRRARNRVWIHNAYLTSDAVLYELVEARRRGVDVRVILPLQNDSGFIGRSNALAANVMLRHGIRVFIYPGMSHVKAAVYDGWACLGSANFDRLSLRLNKEANIATSHPAAVTELVNRVFLPDFKRAPELTEPLNAGWLDYLKELVADHL